ncbi:hypothetical protein TNCV_4318021 [Trichonephila clavipes]|nr:hypothetical protein TNCV_4318021 [Trichonephila clavipes]
MACLRTARTPIFVLHATDQNSGTSVWLLVIATGRSRTTVHRVLQDEVLNSLHEQRVQLFQRVCSDLLTKNRYLALSALRHWGATAPQIARDLTTVSGREEFAGKQPSCRELSLRSASSLVHAFDGIQQKRLDIVELKASVMDTHKNGVCFFQ